MADNQIHFSKHIPALDGVRGIAILLVILHHLSYTGTLGKATLFSDRLFYKATYPGWIGVDLFFVLSGFLITGILYDTKTNNHFFRNFYMRRFLRIFPLYYAFLAGYFILLPNVISLGHNSEALRADQIWYWTYLANIKIALNGWPEIGFIGHFWTLAIEEQFYLLWPLLVYSFRHRNLCIICVACILTALAVRLAMHFQPLSFSTYPAVFVLTPARMDTLAIGALIALLVRNRKSQQITSDWAKPLLLITGTLLLGYFLWKRNLREFDPLVYTIGYTVIAGFFGALLILLLNSSSDKLLNKFFSNNILIFLGRYSYALYVFHPFTIKLIKKVGFLKIIRIDIMGSQLLGQFIYSTTIIGISLILSLCSWLFIESQFLKLKRLYSYNETNKKIIENKFDVFFRTRFRQN